MAAFTVFYVGPSLVHTVYRAYTSDVAIEQKRELYHQLANAEFTLTEADKEISVEKGRRLFLWFHARGLRIDEGHEELSTADHWNELFEYWQH